jgi:PIN domain nuclease of toxin-antitoxin system
MPFSGGSAATPRSPSERAKPWQRRLCLGNLDQAIRIGKLPGVAVLVADLDATISDQGFRGLAISVRHGQIAGALPGAHRDPFDRMLIAQAMHETLALVSNEHVFDTFGVARLW